MTNMQPTSDERREVARKLREQLRYMRKNNSYDEDANVVDCGNSAYRNIAGSVEPYGNIEKGNYVHIIKRLADIIDPTCDVMDDNRLTSDFDYVCRACGEHFSTCDRPNYCPGCGARVVRDDD